MITRGAVACMLVVLGWDLAAEVAYVGDGVYSDRQAEQGRVAYRAACASCHLEDLSGDGDAPPLKGRGFLARWAELSVGDLIAATRTTMPKEAPDSLSFSTYVELSAYLLQVNGMPSGERALPVDVDALWNVVIAANTPPPDQ